MEKTITLGEQNIRYTLLQSKRSRSVRLSVACGGVFMVSAPERMPEHRIDAFIKEKAAWVLRKITYFSKFPPIPPAKRFSRKKHFTEHKERARALVENRLAHFNRHYGLKWNSITIRNQRSRWGSCSRKKNLNFNYTVALLPPHLADYIIVHELCHLGELNHSARFWSLVSQTLPHSRALRAELRRTSIGWRGE